MASLRCVGDDFENHRFNNDNFDTVSSQEQKKVESSVHELYSHFRQMAEIDPESPALCREAHIEFLKKGLTHLSQSYECLNASRPWLCYWIIHSLELLEDPILETTTAAVLSFLQRCQHPDGGFAGGPDQLAHLAPTYAAVNALCILGTEEAYNVIDRHKLYNYLMRMKMPEGSFQMHEGGEVDIRGAYCALAVASLTNLLTQELVDGTAEWIVSCQTYEGGFAGTPAMEAHGGYTFCGFASLVILGKEKLCDVPGLLRWTANRQMRYEGGFQGRTNKLVDGCYSFWQGGIFPLLHRELTKTDSLTMGMEKWLFNQAALQEYLLICCQCSNGGLIDKPGKQRDYYHTCYTLSGLSIAQHFAGGNLGSTLVIGNPNNELLPTHPLFNISIKAVCNAVQYFENLEVPHKKEK